MKIADKIKINWIIRNSKDKKIKAYVSNLKQGMHFRDKKQLDLYYIKSRIKFKMARGY